MAKIDEYLDYHHTNTRKCTKWMDVLHFHRNDNPTVEEIQKAKEDAIKAYHNLD